MIQINNQMSQKRKRLRKGRSRSKMREKLSIHRPPRPFRKTLMKGWKSRSPKRTKGTREKMKKKHGSACFLDPKNLKYPVCNPRTGAYDCGGIRAAKSRAAQFHKKSIEAKADRLWKKGKCSK